MQSDRRLFPRYNLTCAVEVQLDPQHENLVFITKSNNISQKAIEVSCDEDLINTLVAQKQYPHTGRLRFHLPNSQHSFDLAAQVVSHRRLSQHQFLLAFIFTETENGWNQVLNEYFKTLRNSDH